MDRNWARSWCKEQMHNAGGAWMSDNIPDNSNSTWKIKVGMGRLKQCWNQQLKCIEAMNEIKRCFNSFSDSNSLLCTVVKFQWMNLFNYAARVDSRNNSNCDILNFVLTKLTLGCITMKSVTATRFHWNGWWILVFSISKKCYGIELYRDSYLDGEWTVDMLVSGILEMLYDKRKGHSLIVLEFYFHLPAMRSMDSSAATKKNNSEKRARLLITEYWQNCSVSVKHQTCGST